MINTLFRGAYHTIRITFWLGLWFFSLGILLAFLVRWWSGDHLIPVRLMNYFMPWLLLGLIPGLVVAGWGHRYRLFTALAVPSLIIVLNYAPLFLPRPSVALADGQNFKVMSYNVWRRNRNISAMEGIIRQEQPDILLLQELRQDQVLPFRNTLNDLYPDADLHFVYDPYSLQAVASRYPVTPVAMMFEKGRAQKVQLETPNGPITVINIHPNFSHWQRRYRQMSTLLNEDIITATTPTILGGDFNTTKQTEIYNWFDQHLKNAHWEAGWGFGFTFPSSVPKLRGKYSLPSLVRIDHIFYSDHFYAHNAGTLTDSGGSDHMPVVAEFSWIK